MFIKVEGAETPLTYWPTIPPLPVYLLMPSCLRAQETQARAFTVADL